MSQPSSAPRGFTLIEVALAITIVAVVVLAAVGLLVPSTRAIDEVLTSGQATRLRQEIEKEFSVVRPGESFANSFQKAYSAVKDGGSSDGLLVAFTYRAKRPTVVGGGVRPDGHLEPFTEAIAEGSPGSRTYRRVGQDFVLESAVMRATQYANETALQEALDGRLFVVRLQYLEGLLPTASDTYFKGTGYTPGAADAFPEAVIPCSASFYAVDSDAADTSDALSRVYQRITNSQLKPVLVLNLGFNR